MNEPEPIVMECSHLCPERWAETICDGALGVDSAGSVDAPYESTVTLTPVNSGLLVVVRQRAGVVVASRTPERIASDETEAAIWIIRVAAGQTEVVLGGRRHGLRQGDLVVASTLEPFAVSFAAGCEVFMVFLENRFVASVLGAPLPGHRILAPGDPVTAILSQQLAALQPHGATIRNELWPSVWRSVLHLLLAATAAR